MSPLQLSQLWTSRGSRSYLFTRRDINATSNNATLDDATLYVTLDVTFNVTPTNDAFNNVTLTADVTPYIVPYVTTYITPYVILNFTPYIALNITLNTDDNNISQSARR